jgi:hypothetical protein
VCKKLSVDSIPVSSSDRTHAFNLVLASLFVIHQPRCIHVFLMDRSSTSRISTAMLLRTAGICRVT